MPHTPPRLRLAVIGAGPRALGAVEALARRAQGPVAVTVFDPGAAPGAGPNFAPAACRLELVNLPLRSLDLPAPGLPGAGTPSLHDWLAARPGAPTHPDAVLPRPLIGAYLADRWQGLAQHLGGALNHLSVTAQGLHRAPGGGWIVTDGTARHGPFDAVLLCPGQPRTEPDEQLARWQTHARAHGLTLLPAYPLAALHKDRADWSGTTVAIRGLGLSALDVLRGLSMALGGRIADGRYHPSGREPARIVPFSLDGQPPMPRPATAELDAPFAPDRATFDRLDAALAAPDPASHLIETLAPAVAEAMRQTGANPATDRPEDWIDAELSGKAAPEHPDPVAALHTGIAMATGQHPATAGYATGQVWRWLQPHLRARFLHHRPGPQAAEALIDFDEGMKRYAYGPPAPVAQDLAILIGAGLIDLHAAEDPSITLEPGGWRLAAGADAPLAQVMVDAVLPPPALDRLCDPLLADLHARGHLRPLADGLAARTGRDGTLPDAPGLALLGRLATGSVIGADSLPDCLNPDADAPASRWAAALCGALQS